MFPSVSRFPEDLVAEQNVSGNGCVISENSVNLGNRGKNKVKSVLRTLIEKCGCQTAEADFLDRSYQEIGFKSET